MKSRYTLHVSLLGDLKRIVDLDPNVPNSAFELRVPQQQLHGTQVLRFSIDQRRLRAPHGVCAIRRRVEPDFFDPSLQNPGILPCAEVRRVVDPAREEVVLLGEVDGSKFKAVNARDRNFTPNKIKKRQEQIEESIKRYLDAVDTADRTLSGAELQAKTDHLQDKLKTMRDQMRRMKRIEQRLKHEPDEQLSLTDSDARSMATSGRGSGIVGYNVQTAVDTKHHLIVAHEVTNEGHDRTQLAPMAVAAREAMGKQKLLAIADRGYFSGLQIKACCGGRHRRDLAQAYDLRSEIRGALQQERFHLHRSR